MTFQEAYNSGKPMRRKSWEASSWLKDKSRGNLNNYGVQDILATDWEVKREPMVIWVNVYADSTCLYVDEACARRLCAPSGVTKKFVEVIDE